MTQLPTHVPTDEERYLIPTPGPDETLRSVLMRVADLYQWNPGRLWALLQEAQGGAHSTIDDPSSADMERLACRLAVGRGRLDRLRLADGDMLLAPEARCAYCPQCWREDDLAGRPRHFRRRWAGVFAIHCAQHGMPLFPWHPAHGRFAPGTHDDISMPELVWQATTAVPEALDALGALVDFADTVSACLSGNGAWPVSWLGDARQARKLLTEVMAVDALGNPPLIVSAQAPLSVRTLVHSGRALVDAGLKDGWRRLRQAGDPGVRRMALWLVGAWLVPTWPAHFQPSLSMPNLP